MSHSKGQRVRHPTVHEWGLGQVLQDSSGDTTRIFFVGAGEKVISNRHVALILVRPEDAADPVLDNLHLSEAPGIKYRSLPDSIQYFLEQFPDGFYGSRFLEEERDYKVNAHNLAVELLDRNAITSLSEEKAYEEIAARALRVSNATNLIFPNEKMALKDGLRDSEAKERFARGLIALLHDSGQFAARFERFAGILGDIGAARWTTATYFPFVLFPNEFMFVKPTVTQNAAAVCRFEISYRPQVNWGTYQRVLYFSNHLRNQLAGLRPRDMIDVQSFMWCIAPKT